MYQILRITYYENVLCDNLAFCEEFYVFFETKYLEVKTHERSIP